MTDMVGSCPRCGKFVDLSEKDVKIHPMDLNQGMHGKCYQSMIDDAKQSLYEKQGQHSIAL